MSSIFFENYQFVIQIGPMFLDVLTMLIYNGFSNLQWQKKLQNLYQKPRENKTSKELCLFSFSVCGSDKDKNSKCD